MHSLEDRELYLELLDSYAMAVNSHGEPELAQAFYGQVIQLAEKDGLDDVLAYAYYGLGTTHFICHQSDQAKAYWHKAVAIAERIGNQAIPASVKYFLTPDQSHADILRSVQEARDGPLAKLGKWRHYAESQLRAYSLIRSDRYEEAKAAYEQVVAQAMELNEQQGLAIALFHLGAIAGLADRYDEAVKYFRQSEQIAVRMNDHLGLSLVYSALGLLHLRQNRFNLGRPFLEESVSLEREYGRTQSLAENLYWLGYAFANTGDPARAEACFQEARLLFMQTDPSQVEKVDETLSRLHAALASPLP